MYLGQCKMSNLNEMDQKYDEGTIYICSKSIVFRTHEQNPKLLKFLFKNLISLEIAQNCLNLQINKIVEVRLFGAPGPYIIKNFKKTLKPLISLEMRKDVSLKKLLEWCTYLQSVLKNDSSIEDPQFEIIHSLIEKFPEAMEQQFTLHVQKEQLQTKKIFVKRILPLVSQYSFLSLTTENLYLQVIQINQDCKYEKIPLRTIRGAQKRRYQLQ